MLDKIKQSLGSKKTKAAIFTAFFVGLYQALPSLEPYLPDWALTVIAVFAKVGAVIFGAF
ncbi:hypothetical protein P7F88_25105 [Vibrio hannami]|uniref:hypothetical protein n=1 Tax=Vibrio hannami TaxID=2717094 RepID=UPI0024100D29|nr:hypothetical protein [Vibrio hannami]MDG3089143.1 hypothetical protein [Vibrio hannami]